MTKQKSRRKPYLANRLELLRRFVIAGEQKSAVTSGSFTGAVVASNHDDIQRVADSFERKDSQSTRLSLTALPVILAISFSRPKTDFTVSLGGWNMSLWFVRLICKCQ